jgi:hypothetical protein
MMSFLFGILIAGLIVVLAHAMLRPRSRGFYGLMVIFSSLTHLVLRIEKGGLVPISLEALFSGLFIALAVGTVRWNSPSLSWSMLAGGLFFHSGLDLLRTAFLTIHAASPWYPPFCSSVNGALGVWALFLILTRPDQGNDRDGGV